MSPEESAVKSEFFREYTAALEAGSASFFAGAGLSLDAGFVDWRGLLRDFASRVGLDIETEHDMPLVAQYYIDESNHQRGQLVQHLRNHFDRRASVTPAYSAMAKLPLRAVWTTNYDDCIERAYRSAEIEVDIKNYGRRAAWTSRRPDTSQTIYKMHGDISDPDNLVLSRDDYDRYAREYSYVLEALKTHLAQETFLFAGFGFTDPNLDHVFAQIRAEFGDTARTHWVLMKRQISEPDATRQRLWIRTMQRYGVRTVLVEDYDEIPQILNELNQRLRRRHVFVSGSSSNPDPFGLERLETFSKGVGNVIIESGRNLVSGFGLGVGPFVLTGAAEAVYRGHSDPSRRLKLHPFPQPSPGEDRNAELDEKWRHNMIQSAGFAIFISGNKMTANGISTASGVQREFEIAISYGARPLPIAVTGWAAAELHSQVGSRFEELLPGADRADFDALADVTLDDEHLLGAIGRLMDSMSP